MPEHTAPWRPSEIENYEALRDEVRHFIAESLTALRKGTATEADTEHVIRQVRDELFDQGWSTSRDAGRRIGS